MSVLLAVIKKELRAMTRDVHGLLVLFVMPSVFILIMSMALRDTFKLNVAEKVRWQSWDEDRSEASAAFLKHLPAVDGNVIVRERPDLDRALAADQIQMGLVIEKGFSKALTETENKHAFVTVWTEPGTPPALIGAFRAEVSRALSLERMTAFVDSMEVEPEEAAAVKKLSDETLLEVKFRRDHEGLGELTSVQQSVPAWLVFAMFFVVIPLSTIFIAEKQQGTLARLRSLQVSTTTLLAGKVVPFYLVNLVQAALMLLVGRYVVPVLGGDALRLDIDWLALWAVASAVSLGAIGFALAVAAVAKTTEQATTVGGVANILFGALGGVMVPKLVMPAAMQQVTLLSPMAWGLNGFIDVFVRGAHLGGLLMPIGLLLAFAAFCLVVASWQIRRTE
jgi:ABC-2 type transport system permease protein